MVRTKGAPWTALHDVAAPQGGYFTLEQARACGVTQPLLAYHCRPGGYVRPVFRAVFRFAASPVIEPYDFALPYWVWLGNGAAGAFSHQSALELHGALVHAPGSPVVMTVPPSRTWRRKAPTGLRVERDPLEEDACVRLGPFGLRVTTVLRAFEDTHDALRRRDPGYLRAGLLTAALQRAVGIGLLTEDERLGLALRTRPRRMPRT